MADNLDYFPLIQGFLRNERENAILAAIEEAKKNVRVISLFCFKLVVPGVYVVQFTVHESYLNS